MEPVREASVKSVTAACSAGTPHSPSIGVDAGVTANSEERGRLASRPYSSVKTALLTPRFGYRGGRSGARGFEEGEEMKIILFSIKFDKFTMLFGKFLKCYIPSNDCIKKNYRIYLSVTHSDLSNKKSFSHPAIPRICPHFLSHRITPTNPPSSGSQTLKGGSEYIIPCHIESLILQVRDMYEIPIYFHGLFM